MAAVSGPVFRKLSQRWWWQWDLSHGPCCALWFHSYCVCVSTCSGCSSVYYLSGSYDQDLFCFWRVGELRPTNLTDGFCPPTTLSLWPVGFPLVHVLLDTVPTTWNSFSNWQIAVYFEAKVECRVCWRLPWFLSIESCSLSLSFWSWRWQNLVPSSEANCVGSRLFSLIRKWACFIHT